MLGELLSDVGGVSMSHIPYRGPGPAQIDLLAGAIDLQFDTPSSVAPHMASGRLRGLLLTNNERYPGLPEVPTAAEAGFPDLYLRGWTAMYAPRGTPAAIVEKLRTAFKDVLMTQQFQAKLIRLDQVPGFLGGEELLREQKASREFWRKFAIARNITL
jgi:tripartite-type tricarboxylate transporter receptor subunit TctC